MPSRKTWVTIIITLVLIQLLGISLYFLRKPESVVKSASSREMDSQAVRVFRTKELRIQNLTITSSSSKNDKLPIEQNIPSLQSFGGGGTNGELKVNPSKGSEVDVPQAANKSVLQFNVDVLMKQISMRQLSKPMPLHNPSGKTWDKSSFCHKFLIDTFPDAVSVCSGDGGHSNDAIVCHGNSPDPAHMATCTLRNVAIQPDRLYKSIEKKFDKEGTIFLINDKETQCAKPTIEFISKKLEKDDYQLKLLNKILTSAPQPSSVCDVWINKTAFFFRNEKYHIYFRLIEYYTVHKALFDRRVNEGEYVVVRISTNEGMMFPEFDDALFPGAINLKHLPQDATVCFREVITVPRTFSSIPFRAKMNTRIRNQCFQCNGRGMTGSPFYSFRERTLKACNLTDDLAKSPYGSIVMISRKPYVRYPSDEFKRFERVLTNEDQFVNELKKTFPSAPVSVIHLEELPICDQIRYAQSADVLLGVHGAGLVHFWWLRENALAYELEPTFEVGNPSFRMLTTLSGRRYKNVRISGGMKSVSVDSTKVAKDILDMNVVGNT